MKSQDKLAARGIFITFEGGEGAGKTTLIEEIYQTLSSLEISVLKTREPGGTKLGEQIRKVLLDHTEGTVGVSPYAELSLFLASRAQHIFEIIEPALKKGTIVLCDRFNDSSIAYQGFARGLGVERVTQFCQFISQGVEPNLTLYLDIDPKLGLMRAKGSRMQDRIEQEDLSFHQKIREAYLAIHEANPSRFHLLDARLSPKDVFDQAMRLIHPLLLKQHV